MELVIRIDLENDAFQGQAKAVREVRRILANYTSRCGISGCLVARKLMDVNGNSVGSVELLKEGK
jgi:hypothetical protein